VEPGIVEAPEFDAVVPVVPFVVVGCWSAVPTVLDESGIDVTTDAGDRPEPQAASIGTVVAQNTVAQISRRTADVTG